MNANKQKYLLYRNFNKNKKYFESVHTRLKKIVQEKTYKPLLIFGKAAQQAKNVTVQICFKSCLRFCEIIFPKKTLLLKNIAQKN